MGFEVSFGKARCAARYGGIRYGGIRYGGIRYGGIRYGVSGKHRNAADEPSKPTEGRVLSRSDSVAALIRCGGIRCGGIRIALRTAPCQNGKSPRSNDPE